MTRTVHCVKLNKEAEALDFPPYPGELGKKIYETVSKEAWQMWLAHQTLLTLRIVQFQLLGLLTVPVTAIPSKSTMEEEVVEVRRVLS